MSGASRDWLSDAEATARRLAADNGLLPVDEVECVNQCGRWVTVGSQTACNHDPPVCDDCYPNGCEACEWQVHETLMHREIAVNRILSAALELRTGADDLSETDLQELGPWARKDVLRHVNETFEKLLRVRDVLQAIEDKRS